MHGFCGFCRLRGRLAGVRGAAAFGDGGRWDVCSERCGDGRQREANVICRVRLVVQNCIII
jgi:hypothetical protein